MKPKTPLEHTMRNEVRSLRQEEERSAIRHMRDWQRHSADHVDARMKRYKKRTLDEIGDFGDHLEDKIGHEEDAEKRSGVSRRNHPHEKNHGIRREVKRLEGAISQLRDKESDHVQHDMEDGYRHKKANALAGMRDNQAKDESQIIELTRRLSKKSFAKSKVKRMGKKLKNRKTEIFQYSKSDSFPGYGPRAERQSVGTDKEITGSGGHPRERSKPLQESYKSLVFEDQWHYALEMMRPIPYPQKNYVAGTANMMEASDFFAEHMSKSLGIHPSVSREKLARSLIPPQMLMTLVKSYVGVPAHDSHVTSGNPNTPTSPASEHAGFHPLAMGRDLFHKTGPNGGMVPGLTPTSAKVRQKTPTAAHHVYTAPGAADAPAMSNQEWIDNARKAKAAGLIHEYAGANNNDEYHKTFGTSKGGQLSVSVINPRTGKSTVAMGVKVPNPNDPSAPHKVAHFMWDEAHPAGARYVPMLGVHENGTAFVGNRFVDEKHGHFHEARALQHMAEWLSMTLPGHNIVNEAGNYAMLAKHYQPGLHDHINKDTNIVDGAEDAMKKLTDSSAAPGVRKQAWEDIHKHLHAKINGVSQYIDDSIQNGPGMPVVPTPMDPAPTPTDPDNKILRAMGPTHFHDASNFGPDQM